MWGVGWGQMGYEGASVRLETFYFLNEVGLPYNNSLSHISNLDGFLYLCSILNKIFFLIGGSGKWLQSSAAKDKHWDSPEVSRQHSGGLDMARVLWNSVWGEGGFFQGRLNFHCPGESGCPHPKTPHHLGTEWIFNTTWTQIVKSFKGLEISPPAVLGGRVGKWGQPFSKGPRRQPVPWPHCTPPKSVYTPIIPSVNCPLPWEKPIDPISSACAYMHVCRETHT